MILLAIMLVIVGGWYVFESRWDRQLFAASPGCLFENIQPRKAKVLLDSIPGIQVLDVRSEREFAGGSLPRAVNISLSDPAFRKRIEKLDAKKPVLVYCAGGFRSWKAVPILREMGFVSIHHLHRGFMSWNRAGLPAASTSPSNPV
ncbi:MAG: rhodanese-like domain-containing protein [Verrucomicrobia bacterium]|nr:rhodanese-like domain-containing protein [Verrucomicrobiota bacterium]